MANLTLAIDDDLLRGARVYAAQHNTTVNAIVREHLTALVDEASRRERALRNILRMSRESRARSGGRKWTRDELHDRR